MSFTNYRFVELKLEALVKLITDKVLLVEFLMQRTNGKHILIQVLQNFMIQLPISLMDMPTIFDKLNCVYRNHLESEIQNQVSINVRFSSLANDFSEKNESIYLFKNMLRWEHLCKTILKM